MRPLARLLLFLVTAAPVLVPPGSARAQPARPRPAAAPAPADSFAAASRLPVDPAVRIGTLANGLRYYVRRNARPEQRAELRLVVNAGSILEDADQRGLAHFVEHMAFNGTRRFAKNDIVKVLESLGVRFGADLNAATGFDETVYILPVPTDSARALEQAFAFLGDVAGGILFDSAEVVRERGVVLSEWRSGLGAGERIRARQFPVIFRGSRYAERLPIGDTAVLQRATPGPLRRFWRDWYRPDLMAVVAVGDADPARLEGLVRATFGGLRAPARPRPRTQAPVPLHDSTLVSMATDPELTTSSVMVLWKRPPRPVRTVGDYRDDLVASLQAQMLNRRFGELRLKPDAPFLGAGAERGTLVRGSAYDALSATAKEGALLPSMRTLLVEAERARRHGFLAAELERAKVGLLRAYERAWLERDKSPSETFVAEYVDHYLEGEPIPGIAWEYAAVQRLLPGITLAEVNAAMARETTLGGTRRPSRNRVVTVTLPEKAGLAAPTDSAVRAVLREAATVAVTPWVETVADGALVPSPPASGRIVAEDSVPGLGITTWTLANGVTVHVKPTDFNADQVLLTGWGAGGASLAPDSLVVAAALATTAMERGGAGPFSLVDLGKKLTGKVASASASVGELTQGFSGRAAPRDLEVMFQLLWLRLTAPRVDTAAFRTLQQQLDAVVRNKDANPAAVYADTVQVTLARNHPRARPLSAATVQGLSLDAMADFYRARFADFSGYTVIIAGNVDLAALRPLVAQWLGALPATGRRETFRDNGVRTAAGPLEKVVRKGVAPQSQTTVVLSGEAPWSAQEGYLLGSLAQLLQERLLDRLREALGGTYSVSANGSFARDPVPQWQLVIGYGSSPAQADTLWAAVRAELDSLRRVPPSVAEVERIREQQRRSLEVSRKQNGWWTGAIREAVQSGTPLARLLADVDAQMAGLSPEALHAAARRYLTEENRARFVLLPEGPTK
ncbi:MAG: insulinase family protein [Gemmatimonadetes bacterium]|nr:insulinase family protein [Gemmatimonadota bacterium]